MGKRNARALLVGKRKGDTMSRQTNISEMKLKEELEQWETHWTFLRNWVEENVDDNLCAKGASCGWCFSVLKVMDELRPRGENNDE